MLVNPNDPHLVDGTTALRRIMLIEQEPSDMPSPSFKHVHGRMIQPRRGRNVWPNQIIAWYIVNDTLLGKLQVWSNESIELIEMILRKVPFVEMAIIEMHSTPWYSLVAPADYKWISTIHTHIDLS